MAVTQEKEKQTQQLLLLGSLVLAWH